MKHLFSFLLLFCMTAVSAQTILKGDMNNDEQVTITDVTSLVNVILGKAPQEEISMGGDPYKVDNSLVVGTWYKSKTEEITFNEDGTTDFTDAASYKFLPYQGKVLLYNSLNALIKVLNVIYLTSDSLYLDDLTLYTKAIPTTRVTSISLDYEDLSMNPTDAIWLSATVYPEDADNQVLSWSSSNESVATVSDFGEVTAVGRGTSVITCAATDGSGVSTSCTVTVTGDVPVTMITLDKKSLLMAVNDTYELSATIFPTNADNQVVSWSSSDENVVTVTNTGHVVSVGEGFATITCSAMDGSYVTANCQVRVWADHSDEHAYVDLGLPSGTLWATTNIGAENPENYGEYFAWGEVEGTKNGKYNFTWGSYKWGEGENSINKYSTSEVYGVADNIKELELEDDAAYINWGRKWRIPSRMQIDELISTTSTTIEMVKQNNVIGWKITSIINGNSIFLPAAGKRYSTLTSDEGTFGRYWTRDLDTNTCSRAAYLSLSSTSIFNLLFYRCYGYTIRPVRVTE